MYSSSSAASWMSATLEPRCEKGIQIHAFPGTDGLESNVGNTHFRSANSYKTQHKICPAHWALAAALLYALNFSEIQITNLSFDLEQPFFCSDCQLTCMHACSPSLCRCSDFEINFVFIDHTAAVCCHPKNAHLAWKRRPREIKCLEPDLHIAGILVCIFWSKYYTVFVFVFGIHPITDMCVCVHFKEIQYFVLIWLPFTISTIINYCMETGNLEMS